MKQPLAPVALVYAAGLIAAESSGYSRLGFTLALASGLAVATLCSLALNRPATTLRRLANASLWLLLFLAGWANLTCRTAPLSPWDLRSLNLQDYEIATLRGVLVNTPTERVSFREQGQDDTYRFLSTLRLEQLRRHESEWQPASGNILVSTPGTLPPGLHAGRHVQISGVLSKPPLPAAHGLFNYRAYLQRQSIYHQLRTDGTNDWTTLSPQTPAPLSDRFLSWGRQTLSRGLPQQDQPLRLLWAMTLGWQTIPSDTYEPFMRSGTMHVFAVSGLHIALIAGILVSLLRVCQVPRFWSGLIALPLIWFYTAATGWQPSAIRAAIMMSIIIGGWALSRPTDLLNSLCASAFIILLWDPQQLFGASFQLSFFVVLCIALFLPRFHTLVTTLIRSDPLLPADLVPPGRRRLLLAARWVGNALAVSFASWLGSLPLTAYYFHLWSPVTLVANLLVVPLSSCALACNLGSLLCGAWCPWATELFNHTAWLAMRLMLLLSDAFAEIPGGNFNVPAPGLLTIALFYGATALLFRGAAGWFWQTRARCISLASVAALILSGYTWHWLERRQVANINVLPLSGGFAVHCRHSAGGGQFLVDCGRSNDVRWVTVPFLRGQGVNRLAGLVLTHGDIRHVGGALILNDQFAIQTVYHSAVRFRSAVYRHVLQVFGRQDGIVQECALGDHLGPWKVLHPDSSGRFSTADDNALVLWGKFNGIRVLLLSDLGERGQAALAERGVALRADIVVAGLPTAGQALNARLLEQIRPDLIVVADSELPPSERAGPELRERLSNLPAPVVYARTAGSVTLELKKTGWAVHTISGWQLSSREKSSRRALP